MNTFFVSYFLNKHISSTFHVGGIDWHRNHWNEANRPHAWPCTADSLRKGDNCHQCLSWHHDTRGLRGHKRPDLGRVGCLRSLFCRSHIELELGGQEGVN